MRYTSPTRSRVSTRCGSSRSPRATSCIGRATATAGGAIRSVIPTRPAAALPNVEAPADAAVAAAEAQTVAVPGGERVSATSSRDPATEALAARRRIAQIDKEPEAPPQAPHRWQRASKRGSPQSAFRSLHTADSRASCDRKREEGRRHHRAPIALAGRRINVLRAMPNSRSTCLPDFKKAA